MKTENLIRFVENLSLLDSYFTKQNTIQVEAQILGAFLGKILSATHCAFLKIDVTASCLSQDVAGWDIVQNMPNEALATNILKNQRELRNWLNSEELYDEEMNRILSKTGLSSALLLPIRYDDILYGMLCVVKENHKWLEDEKELAYYLGKLIASSFSNKLYAKKEQLSNFVFNTMLDGIKASLYITEIETDEILYMNQAMKQEFHLRNPEGLICWKTLQKNKKERCSFCPINKLQQQKDASVYQWEEYNELTGRYYCKYDSLIKWIDGSVVHLQQAIDITELKTAYLDELTHMLTRRQGKEQLNKEIRQAYDSGEVLTVCLYDINRLKKVNDLFGHAEGDKLIRAVADGVQAALKEQEFGLRLSGDEFVVLFRTDKKTSANRIIAILEAIGSQEKPYEISFCYGLVELSSNPQLSVDEILALADEQMYEQKRKYHILGNELREPFLHKSNSFAYNQERLYEVLVQSTNDYLYVCNMKTGIFHYPKAMVEEFNLPGEIIENAAVVWGAKVHKDDQAAFLESNQEITDGRTVSHCVEYRALNRHNEWVWLRCRGHLAFDEYGLPLLFAGFITNLGKHHKNKKA